MPHRFTLVYLLGFLINKIRYSTPLSWSELFVISYGGLRGAVSYAMAETLSSGPTTRKRKELFQTTSLIIILLTCFVQGGTVRCQSRELLLKGKAQYISPPH
jgi:NhaP-type Na+/H+ or K+/H+ antiporter